MCTYISKFALPITYLCMYFASKTKINEWSTGSKVVECCLSFIFRPLWQPLGVRGHYSNQTCYSHEDYLKAPLHISTYYFFHQFNLFSRPVQLSTYNLEKCFFKKSIGSVGSSAEMVGYLSKSDKYSIFSLAKGR